ncbi:MAG TPA: lysylphosphatidylglycerol synthase transmembrane domain-containing protein [Acidimicrobiales bacterium]|nr:lysylphosphatidylglycerol synthase transmembrane domain-containing protein [Acidimicrobiales bacterium]
MTAGVEPVAEPGRARRATDVLQLIVAAGALVVLGRVADPPAGVEAGVAELVASLPGFWRGWWSFTFVAAALWALALVVATSVRAQWTVTRDLLLAALATLPVTALAGWAATGTWPDIDAWLPAFDPAGWSPPLRLASATAAIMTAAPHVGRPARTWGRWVVGLSALGGVLAAQTSPTEAVAGLLVAVVAAAVVHLALGSALGWPSTERVVAALERLGVPAVDLRVAERQRAGAFLLTGRDPAGAPLLVKVVGRDAYDTRLVSTVWRLVWYRRPGTPTAIGRFRQVEREAFLTLFAARTGSRVPDVVTLGRTDRDDALLVLRPVGTPLDRVPDRWSPALAASLWRALGHLHAAGVAHGEVDDEHLAVDDRDDTGLVAFDDLSGARPDAAPERFHVDRAQALLTTALALGVPAAVDVAATEVDHDDLARALPYLQSPALTTAQRAAVRRSGVDLDQLRRAVAERLGSEVPGLQQLRRVTVGSLVRLGMLVIAFFVLASAVGGLDLDDLVDQLRDADWALVTVGLVVAQLPRFAGALSTLGASPVALPLGPVYALQLAMSYIGLVLPGTAARVAVSIRFFQRHGLAPGSAVAIGALDGLASFAFQAFALVTILVATPMTLGLSLDADVVGAAWRLLRAVVLIGVAALVVVLLAGPWRRRLVAWVTALLSDAWSAAQGLGSPRRIGLLFGGSAASELLFALTLGAFVAALGHPVGLLELLVINISVSLLSGLLPVPGGIGVVEGGLIFGLVSAGVPEEAAFASVIAYRIATFYLPPLWGWFALRWLQREGHL